MRACACLVVLMATLGLSASWLYGDEAAPRSSATSIDTGITLESVGEAGPNHADEPLRDTYSPDAAAEFLDTASLEWQKARKCMTCHTNYVYLLSRPFLGIENEAHRSVRRFAEELVEQRWVDKGPRWDAEVVMTALALAANDAQTTGELHPATRTALDRIWTVQTEEGSFSWLACSWPPYELDDDFGSCAAAVAVAIAPEDYASTPAAQQGIARLQKFFGDNELSCLHHQAWVLWADSLRPDTFLDAPARKQILAELLALQNDDGGWSAGALGPWPRHDGEPQARSTSDGLGTGFVTFVLRQAGMSADDPVIARATTWIKSNQRASGRWFSRSLYRDGRNFLTHAASAWSVIALGSCGELDASLAAAP